MTVYKIEYTSCPDGVEGIRGFQVRARTPGAPKPLMDAALRDSVYEPGPDLPSQPGPAELDAFPVAFGRTATAEGVAVYRSTYVGKDHTGRWGNYFAQAVLLPGGLPAGTLALDHAESPAWERASRHVGDLPPVTDLPPAPGPAGVEALRTFLAAPGRVAVLTRLLTAMRAARRESSRLIVVAPAEEALVWLAALVRSLPHAVARDLDFCSYSSRPHLHRAGLVLTTDDVVLPRYGDFRVADVSSRPREDPVPESGDFDVLAARTWLREGPQRLLDAVAAGPADLDGERLDDFARVAALLDELGAEQEWDEASLLDALRRGQELPGVLTRPWDRVAQAARACGAPRDTSGWGALLRWTQDQRIAVPGPLLREYAQVAVADLLAERAPADVWLPPLDDATTRRIARSLTERLLGPSPSVLALQLVGSGEQPRLAEETLALAEERLAALAVPDAVDAVDGGLARLPAARSSALPVLRTVTAVATLRRSAGAVDAVSVLRDADEAAFGEAERLGDLAGLLWPEVPGPRECVRFLRELPDRRLRESGLLQLVEQRLLVDCTCDAVTPDDADLADALREHPELSNRGREAVDSVRYHRWYRNGPSWEKGHQGLGAVLNLAAANAPVAAPAVSAMVDWSFRLGNPDWHASFARELVVDKATRAVYRRRAGVLLPELEVIDVACFVVAWAKEKRGKDFMASAAHQMLEEVLPAAVARSGRRRLDAVGEQLPHLALVAVGRTGPPNEASTRRWAAWWAGWRDRHEPQGLMGRLLPRRGSS